MANTHSRERGRNGGERWRPESERSREGDDERPRWRGRESGEQGRGRKAYGQYERGYGRDRDDDRDYGRHHGDEARGDRSDYGERTAGGAFGGREDPDDWQQYAPGGSWYGREDAGDQPQIGRYGRGRGRDYGGEGEDRNPEAGGYYRGVYRRSSYPYSSGGGAGSVLAESWTISGPYAGKGPKGYRRSNEQITEEASQRLYRHGRIDASDIDVSCEDGVLILKGTVDDRQTKRLAEDCVESVFGVEDVVNELRVRRPSSPSARDQQGGAERDEQTGEPGDRRSGPGQAGKKSR